MDTAVGVHLFPRLNLASPLNIYRTSPNLLYMGLLKVYLVNPELLSTAFGIQNVCLFLMNPLFSHLD